MLFTASEDLWETYKVFDELDAQDKEAEETGTMPEYQCTGEVDLYGDCGNDEVNGLEGGEENENGEGDGENEEDKEDEEDDPNDCDDCNDYNDDDEDDDFYDYDDDDD